MAISRDQKLTQVAELKSLFDTAKLTVTAKYTGLSVADMQALRAEARNQGVTVKVVKNRLVRVALSQLDSHKAADTADLEGQLLYAFSAEDETLPAQLLAKFRKTHEQLELVSGFSAEGKALSFETVTALASLPTKEQLRGMLVSTLAAPLSGMLSVANGAQRGMAQVLQQQSEKMTS